MFVTNQLKRILTHSKIGHKIGYGYVVVITIFILGIISGLALGDYYENKAYQKLQLANRKILLLSQLHNHILQIRSHPKTLIVVVDDSIWFEYETNKFSLNSQKIEHTLSELNIFLDSNYDSIDNQKLKKIVKKYDYYLDEYEKHIKSLWRIVTPISSNDSQLNNQDMVLQLIKSQKIQNLEIQFEKLSESLSLIINSALDNQNSAEKEMIKANLLRMKIILSSIIISLIISTISALYTGKIIAYPLEQLTHIAQRVTQESNFQLKAPVTTQDEVGKLATSMNQLIQWIDEHITELKEARQTLEKRVEQRTIELQQALKKLKALVNLDGLTQIFNRRYFDEVLYREWQRGRREKSVISLILCDVDYFKIYNETYGHLGGDSCLQEVAQGIRRQVKRPSDLVARYGGEEFVILLPNTDLNGALALAEMIRNAIEAMNIPHENSLVSDHVTISMGVTSKIPQETDEYEHLIEEADDALYQAKENGRNCVCYFINSS
ncbi:putative diguanylate cyclase [Crocosphaera subtropica ATCC 51142]|uniref:Diguanylate cyclase n=1 Tax=Crocosphaera subtropica (strain ATCC 51142 / BH68) TaxID=43989 RepID=B1WQB8_CROS5|nr:diguanylate cyclase [Crocosphaera subtropica]ACB50040.1 putative diguanylate cyclase [Crocosphaera subtropica ATCC 51142]